jgi:hypothetical protein
MHQPIWRGVAAALIGASACAGLVCSNANATSAPPGRAAVPTKTFNRFSVFEWQQSANPTTGKAISNVDDVRPGDTVEFADLEYSGTAKSHATSLVGSDHGLCTVNAHGVPVCEIEVAVGGSLLLARGDLGDDPTTNVDLYGGTGAFAGVKGGSVKVTELNPNFATSNSNLVFTLVY